MLFGAIMDYYDEHKPDGEIMKFKELVSSILGCEVKDAIPEMNALLQSLDRAQAVARQKEIRQQIPEEILRLLPD